MAALKRGPLGCADRERLPAEQRETCDEQRGLAANDAPMRTAALEPGKQARLDKVSARKRAWKAYQECRTPGECDALYPGHLAAARRIVGQ